MFQFRTLLILFVISSAFISIAYAEAQDEFAVKSRHAHSGSGSGSDSGRHHRAVSPISNRQRRYAVLGYGSGLFHVAVAHVTTHHSFSGIYNYGQAFSYAHTVPYYSAHALHF